VTLVILTDVDVFYGNSLVLLSVCLITKKSKTTDIPDFTRGAWKTNKPVDITLNGGATTNVRDIKPDLKMK
jgi:hypothetical protein